MGRKSNEHMSSDEPVCYLPLSLSAKRFGMPMLYSEQDVTKDMEKRNFGLKTS